MGEKNVTSSGVQPSRGNIFRKTSSFFKSSKNGELKDQDDQTKSKKKKISSMFKRCKGSDAKHIHETDQPVPLAKQQGHKSKTTRFFGSVRKKFGSSSKHLAKQSSTSKLDDATHDKAQVISKSDNRNTERDMTDSPFDASSLAADHYGNTLHNPPLGNPFGSSNTSSSVNQHAIDKQQDQDIVTDFEHDVVLVEHSHIQTNDVFSDDMVVIRKNAKRSRESKTRANNIKPHQDAVVVQNSSMWSRIKSFVTGKKLAPVTNTQDKAQALHNRKLRAKRLQYHIPSEYTHGNAYEPPKATLLDQAEKLAGVKHRDTARAKRHKANREQIRTKYNIDVSAK